MPTIPIHGRLRSRLAAPAIVLLAALGLAGAAHGATATETITAGSLSFINSTPAAVTFPATTLNGTDQTKTASQPFDVSDATGSNSGWSITATSTLFTSGTHTLPNDATYIQTAPTVACDSGSTCTTATNSVGYPFYLPADTTAPTAQKMFNAAANTGMGNQTVTPTWRLRIPATTWTGGGPATYSSTWTFTLVSGP